MKPKTPPRPPANTATTPSVAGEEDPGAALDAVDEAAPDAVACNRCGGSGRFADRPCPTCGGTGKVVRGIGSA